jgi:hypothetical protein
MRTATAQTYAATGTTTVSVSIAAEAGLVVNTATTTLGAGASVFANFTGSTSLTYKIRTSKSGGSGSITLQVTSDFSPSNGPSVASPPTAGDALSYTCTVSSPGTACSGPITSSTSSSTSVATFGTDAHSTASGNSATVAWTLTDDPVYKTASYSATVTFTVSAT